MSGIRTFSTPKPPDDKEKRFHVLRFDDSWKKEQVVIRSQGRLDETSFASTFQTSHADRHILVGGKNEKTGESGGSLFTTVGGEDNLHVNKSRYTGIDVNEEQTIKGHLFVDVTGAVKIYSAAEINLSAPKIVLEASAKVSIKVGSSFVVVDPSGVFITGPMVQINSGGSALSVADFGHDRSVRRGISRSGRSAQLARVAQGQRRWRRAPSPHGQGLAWFERHAQPGRQRSR